MAVQAVDVPAPVVGSQLRRLGERPRLAPYLAQLWQRRHFLVELARSRFRADTAEYRIGIAWVVVEPLIDAAVYGVIFGVLMANDTRPGDYADFLVAGVFVFQFFADSLSRGAKAVTGSAGLVRTVHFPRVLLPLAAVLQQVYALVPTMAVLAVLVLVTGQGIGLSWLLAPCALALMAVFNTGVAMIAARLVSELEDMSRILPFVSRILFYTSGVFYALESVVTTQPLATIAAANPLHIYMTLVRSAFLRDIPVAGWMWPAAAGWALLLVVVGFAYFWGAEERYGRE